MKISDTPAFAGPIPAYAAADSELARACMGMTLRQYYAGLAMQGMLANAEITRPNEVAIADAPVKIADELCAALEK